MSGDQIIADSIPVISINSLDLAEFVNALIPSINTANFVDMTTDQTIGGIKSFLSPPVMSGQSITSIPLTAIPGLSANFTRKNIDQTITGVYTFSANPIFSTNAILDTYLSTNVNDTVSTVNTFMTLYNQYIGFVSNIGGDVMNLINCNPKLTAGYNLDMNGASIKANGLSISDVKVSFLNQVDGTNKIPTSCINGYGSGYLTITSASSTYQLQANMSSYQLISGMSSYVNKSSDETIGGIKTFSSPPVISGASILSGTIPTTAFNSSIKVASTNVIVGVDADINATSLDNTVAIGYRSAYQNISGSGTYLGNSCGPARGYIYGSTGFWSYNGSVYSFTNPYNRMYVVATNIPIAVGTATTTGVTTIYDENNLSY